MTALHLFVDPAGRIGRAPYWLGLGVLSGAAVLVDWLAPADLLANAGMTVFAPYLTILSGSAPPLAFLVRPESLFAAALFYLGFCLYGKRLRDVALSPWWYAVALACLPLSIFILGLLFAIYAATQGQSGNPRWSQGFAFGVAQLAAPFAWLVFTIILGAVPARQERRPRGPRLRLHHLLFSPRGRIGRGQFWIGWAASLVLLLAVVTALTAAGIPPGPAALLPLLAASVYIGVCLYGKRLHDLGLPAWGYAVYLGSLFLLFCCGVIVALVAFGPSGTPTSPGHLAAQRVTLAVLVLVSAAFTLWLGAAPGQRGQNRFGPPGAAAAA